MSKTTTMRMPVLELRPVANGGWLIVTRNSTADGNDKVSIIGAYTDDDDLLRGLTGIVGNLRNALDVAKFNAAAQAGAEQGEDQ